MKTTNRMRILGVLAVAGALALAGAPAHAAGGSNSYTCAGGVVPSGSYASLTVTGPCSVAAGAVITVSGNVTVTTGAMLDAQSDPSTITVGGGVSGLAGSIVAIGCQPASMTGNSAHPCTNDPEGHSTITVRGNVSLGSPVAVAINGVAVTGNITVTGGGSEIPWSVKNNTVGGSITVSGQTAEWIGVMFNKVSGNVSITNVVITDPHPGAPGFYIVQNKVRGNLACSGITPGVSGGFVPGAVNTVGGRATGQCGALV